MSAICGIIYPENLPDPREIIEKRDIMMQAMAHRGVDGSGVWNNARVALGFHMLHVTPESLHETQPLIRHNERLVCIADCRIDNRDELIEKLGIKNPAITDSELILDAYEQWGEDCPKHFIGDFAFAIWDDIKQKLFCGRDHYGIRQFFYTLQEGVLYFSTELQSLLKLAIKRHVDRERLKHFLAGSLPDQEEESTFYREIKILIPAHTLSFAKKIKLIKYWQLEKERNEPKWSEQEFTEACREQLEQAVKCRIRTPFNIGSELSGGIDSSIVSLLARHISPQKDFYSVHIAPQGIANESDYAEAAAKQGNIKLITHEGGSPFGNYKNRFDAGGEPWNMANMGVLDLNAEKLAEKNIRVSLNGQFGDVYGTFDIILDNFLKKMDWSKVNERIIEHAGTQRLRPILETILRRELNKYANANQLFNFYRLSQHISKQWSVSSLSLFKRYYLKSKLKKALAKNTFVKAAYLPKALSKDRTSSNMNEVLYEHMNLISMGQAYQGLDISYKKWKIEPCSPLADIRLVKFMYNSPIDLLYKNGLNRYLLRNSAKDLLPEKIYTRTNKHFFNEFITSQLQQKDKSIIEQTLLEESPVNSMLIKKNTQNWFETCHQENKHYKEIWAVVMLKIWLKNFDIRAL